MRCGKAEVREMANTGSRGRVHTVQVRRDGRLEVR